MWQQLFDAAVGLRRQPLQDVLEVRVGIVKRYGFTPEEVFVGISLPAGPTVTSKGTRGAAKSPRVAKYRHEDQTWSGRGRKPGWIVELLAAGRSLESLLVRPGRKTGLSPAAAPADSQQKPAAKSGRKVTASASPSAVAKVSVRQARPKRGKGAQQIKSESAAAVAVTPVASKSRRKATGGQGRAKDESATAAPEVRTPRGRMPAKPKVLAGGDSRSIAAKPKGRKPGSKPATELKASGTRSAAAKSRKAAKPAGSTRAGQAAAQSAAVDGQAV